MDGTILGDRFLLADELGSGSTGAVYRATDLRTGGPVAVKVPHAYLARDPLFRERLRREARLAAALTSPRVVRVVDLDQHEGVPYLVMEYVAGETLAERLRREGPLPLAEALAVAREVARALEAAHALGVVHRDLTPRNIKLVDGQVKVLDFGIAQAAGLSGVTPPGGLFSAPAYTAPERLSGDAGDDDPRADLYSVGAILYTLLTGRPPAPATRGSAGGPATAGLAPDLTGLPPAAERILARCLAPDPARRYGSAAELSAALGTVLAALNVRPTLTHVTPTSAPSAFPQRAAGAPVGTPAPAAPPAEASGESTRILPISSATTQPTGGAVPGIPHNLPAALTTFVGREVEVGDLMRLLRGPPGGAAGGSWSSPRLVTIVGAGGAGKTRLALQVAARLSGEGGAESPFPDGVWLVPLASLADGQLVVEAVAGALGVRAAPGGPVLDAVTAWLRPRRLLLLLDNCEHLVGACAAFAEGALLAAPGLRVLATSREPLGISGEVLWRLPTLPAPDLQALPEAERLLDFAAVRLFVERARGVNPGFALTPENRAARGPHLRSAWTGCPWPWSWRRRAPASSPWSRSPPAWTTASGCSPPGAAPLPHSSRPCGPRWTGATTCSPSPSAPSSPACPSSPGASVWRRPNRSAPAPPAPPAPPCWTPRTSWTSSPSWWTSPSSSPSTPPTTAARRRGRRRRATASRRRCGSTAPSASPRGGRRPPSGRPTRATSPAWPRRQARPSAGPGSAPGTTCWSGSTTICAAPCAPRWTGTIRPPPCAWGTGCGSSGPCGATTPRAGAGWKRLSTPPPSPLLARRSRPGTLPRDATETIALARGNSAAGSLARGRRDYAAARAYHEAALSLWRELDDRRGVAAALGALGGLASDQGDDEGARPLYVESLALRREVGDVGGVALMQTSLGNLAYHRRELPAARDAYREALSRYQELGDAGGEALLRVSLGHVLRALGDVPGAVVQGVAGLDGFRALGDRWGTSLALGLMGRLALDQGDAAAAEAYLAECAAILRALEDRWNLAVALLSQARAALALGDPRRAAELNREGLQLALAGRLQRHVAAGLEATAGLVLHDVRGSTSRRPGPERLRASGWSDLRRPARRRDHPA